MIPLTRPWIGDDEVAAVAEVLRSGMLVQGAQVARFEAAVAEATGRAHAVAVSNGTSAIVLGLRALGVGPGDEVLCPALTWPSPAHAVLELGATPVIVDVHEDEWNVTAEALDAAVTKRTRAAIAIDQFGAPLRTDVESQLDAAGVPLLEDAACALGARFADGRPGGALGALSTISFHPRKVLTTGEGGVVVTDDDNLADALRAMRNHGQSGPGTFVVASTNHRLTDFQGALGAAQMQRLSDAVRLRREHAAVIRDGLPRLRFQVPAAGAVANEQTLGALLPAGLDRDALQAACRARGVQVGALSYALSEVATVPSRAPMPIAEDIVRRGVALPLYPQMTAEEVATVVREIGAALDEVGA